jgi:hypothetical protein
MATRISRRKSKNPAITVRFSEDEWKGIEKFADADCISLNNAIRGLVRERLYGFDPEKIAKDTAADMVRTLHARIEETV